MDAVQTWIGIGAICIVCAIVIILVIKSNMGCPKKVRDYDEFENNNPSPVVTKTTTYPDGSQTTVVSYDDTKKSSEVTMTPEENKQFEDLKKELEALQEQCALLIERDEQEKAEAKRIARMNEISSELTRMKEDSYAPTEEQKLQMKEQNKEDEFTAKVIAIFRKWTELEGENISAPLKARIDEITTSYLEEEARKEAERKANAVNGIICKEFCTEKNKKTIEEQKPQSTTKKPAKRVPKAPAEGK